MSGTRAREAPRAADDSRIRLEGALETVEAATAQCRRAKSLLARRYRTTVAGHRLVFEQLRANHEQSEAAARRIEELGRREEWPPEAEARRALDAYRRAWAELAARIDSLLAATHSGAIERLDALLAEAIDARPGSVLVTLPLAKRNQESLILTAIGVSLVLCTVGLISTRIGGECVAMLAGLSALSALPYLVTGGRLEVFADRLRLHTRFRKVEVALARAVTQRPVQSRPGSAGSVLGEVSIAGLPPFWLASLMDAELLVQLVHLFTLPPFKAPRPFALTPLVLTASHADPRAPSESGALMLLDDKVWFLADGAPTYAALQLPPGTQSAMPLAYALASLGPARRDPLFAALRGEGRLHAVDAAQLGQARVLDTRLELPHGRVQAVFPKRLRATIAEWVEWHSGRSESP